MKDWPLIKLGTLYLTDDRLIGGDKYWAQVEGINQLLNTTSVRHQVTSGGGVYSQYNDVGHAGKEITIIAEFPKQDMAIDLISLLNTAITGKTTINVALVWGTKINYAGTAKPMYPVAAWDEITSKTYKNLRIPLMLIT